MPARPKAKTTKKKVAKKAVKKTSTRRRAEPEEETAIAKREPTAVVSTFGDNVPAWLAEQTGPVDGFDNVESDDLIVPRIEMCQPMSPAVVDDEIANAGDMLNSVSKAMLAPNGEALAIVPILFSKSAARWESKEPGSPMLCRSFDSKNASMPGGEDMNGNQTTACAECVHKEWDRDEDKPPVCTEFKNFLCVLPDFGNEQIMLSFKSTGIKDAKRLATTLKATGHDMYAHRIELTARKDKNDAGTFYNFDFAPAGFVDEDTFALCKRIHDTMKGIKYSPDHERDVTPSEGDDGFDEF